MISTLGDSELELFLRQKENDPLFICSFLRKKKDGKILNLGCTKSLYLQGSWYSLKIPHFFLQKTSYPTTNCGTSQINFLIKISLVGQNSAYINSNHQKIKWLRHLPFLMDQMTKISSSFLMDQMTKTSCWDNTFKNIRVMNFWWPTE